MAATMVEERKATLFDLDVAELELLGKIEALFQEPMNEAIDPGAESERLVDEYLAQLEGVQEQIGAKLIGYVKAIRAKAARAEILQAEAHLYELEAIRLARRAKAEADTADFLQGRLKTFMERRGLTEFEAGTYKLKIINQGGKLPVIFDPRIKPEQIPDEFRREIPAKWEWKRDAIEAALKAGQRLEWEWEMSDDGLPLRIEWARFGERPTKLKIS